ncbi:HEPN domain-containing protein [Gemmatimonadota bacterium]
MMDFSDLQKSGRIKPGRFSSKQVRNRLAIARRDLDAARGNLKSNPEWAYIIAYNAMHQAGRAYLFKKGYRTVGEGHHATVVQFIKVDLGSEYSELLDVMDRMRRNRNRATYDETGTISASEAATAVSTAEEFVGKISKLL